MVAISKRKDRTDALDLSAMQPRDWFVFCERCTFQGEKNTGMKPACPDCGAGLRIATVTEEDAREETGDERRQRSKRKKLNRNDSKLQR